MQLTKLVRVIMMAASVLALAACTHTGKKGGQSTGTYDSNEQVEAMGAGEGSNYGNENNNDRGTAQAALNKHTYYFDFDKSYIHDEDRPAVYKQAEYLMANPNISITLEGHTDPRGSREYNVALGERRANAVADLLKTKGVNPSQIRVVSYGAERLASVGHTEQEYQMDRRAVVVRLQG